MNKIILDLCGGTGSWSNPYKYAGYDVRVITLPEHDVRTYEPPPNVYGVLIASPCDQLSFARTNAKATRNLSLSASINLACLYMVWKFQMRLESDLQKYPPLKFWAWENPNCMLKWYLGKPAFEFDPYDFGDDYKKRTHLWGWFKEPKKNPIKCTKPKFDRLKTKEIHPEYYGKLTRKERRAITPSGFASAFFKANP